MSNVIAINVALLPDADARNRAIVLNARLRENHPQGFALGEDRLVHVTLAQAYVHEGDLETIWQQIKNIALGERLRVQGFDFFPRAGGLGSSGFDLNKPAWLLSTQQAVATVLKPFAQTHASREAFFKKPGEDDIGDSTMNYVQTFFSDHSGQHYNPHITLGRAQKDFLEAIRAETFEPFDFALKELGIYQLGSHGTCRKALRTLSL